MPNGNPKTASTTQSTATPATNFIRNIIEADLASGKYATRTWSGRPGPAKVHEGAPPDPAKIRTRFPPEPNGYLHLGHSKSISLNFGLARDYGGVCHLRFDDTNPTKEEQEYVDSIIDAVHWLGFHWGTHLYFASDYFDTLYAFAERFIEHGLAYGTASVPKRCASTAARSPKRARSRPTAVAASPKTSICSGA
jgi:glutaminyl-tRNA synthetase